MSEQLEKEVVKQKMEPPKMWNVVMINDDFTTVEFVIACLICVFNKSESQAAKITMDIHQKGKGIVGQYSHEIAETKKAMATAFAIEQGHPLKIELEPN